MPATKKKQTRTRRSADDRIAALQANIERIRKRAALQKVRKDPALLHMSAAVRAIDKALKESEDKATRGALNETRAALATCMALRGAVPVNDKGIVVPQPRREKPDPDQVLSYISKHPGSRSEEIAAELATDTLSLRSVLHQLRDDGKIKVEGKARATTYSAK
jgi:hypothetical protein